MKTSLPFLTAYDPPGSSEGTLDPLGLYQIADQLAVMLVPGVRERMQRIRFLTAMSVGALLAEEFEDVPPSRDESPTLVWEWLVVEALVRKARASDEDHWGIPGTLVTRRALDQHGYVDARSYLKTPRIFGFHGVYKRLAVHLGLVDVRLRPARATEALVDAWARDAGFGSIGGAAATFSRWKLVIRRSLNGSPPRTLLQNKQLWGEIAEAFDPSSAQRRERRCLRELLHGENGQTLGALSAVWQLQSEFSDEEYREEALHDRLEVSERQFAPLLQAIRSYEAFSRSLQDAFDVLKATAAFTDGSGFDVSGIADDPEFRQSTQQLHQQYARAEQALNALGGTALSLQSLYSERFSNFAGPLTPRVCAQELCTHHERIQKLKSAEGKRPWFDRLGDDRIFIRPAYREARRAIQPERYVHDYRGWPIRRFCQDLK